jgi:hypothetical protein
MKISQRITRLAAAGLIAGALAAPAARLTRVGAAPMRLLRRGKSPHGTGRSLVGENRRTAPLTNFRLASRTCSP